MIVVPAGLAQERLRGEQVEARRWLDALPSVVERLCEQWRLTPSAERLRHGANALVVPVTQHGEHSPQGRPCVLKVSWHAESVAEEATALRAWDGHHAVLLLDAAPDDGALLLERLDDSRTLQGLDLLAAAETAGDLVRCLAIPAPGGLPRLRDKAAEVAASLRPRQRALGDPLPSRWVDMADRLERELAADAGELLVHSDLHYGNVMAGMRNPWLAIDPRAVAGDPELSVPELMWSRLDEAADDSVVRTLLAAVVGAGALDADKALAWTVVRTVDYWLWGLDAGLTEDPLRCRRLLEVLA